MFAGVLLVAAGLLFDALPFHTYKEYSFWNTSPNYFWIRLGVLLLMLGGLWYLEDYFATGKRLNGMDADLVDNTRRRVTLRVHCTLVYSLWLGNKCKV